MSMEKVNIAICVAHPIQHEIPLYQELAKIPSVNLTVLYFSDVGIGNFNVYGLKNISYGIPVLEGYNYKILKNISPFKTYKLQFIAPDVTKELAAGKFDKVILYGYNSPTSIFVMRYCRKHNIPLYLRAEGESVQPISSKKQRVRQLLLPRIFKRFDYFLALCEANRSHYLEFGVTPEQVKFIPQTVNDEFFAGYDESNFDGLRNKYGITSDDIVFVYGSKQRADKRPMDAVKAFCELHGSVKAKLLMLSDGPLRKECEAYAKAHDKYTRIVFTGYIEFTEMRDLFGLSDVLIMTSFETIGATLYQALFSGLAILSSDMVPGWLDLVKPGINGLVYRAAWLDSLVKTITAMCESRELIETMKANSKQLSEQYTSQLTAAKLAAELTNSH
ncbi:glycosyltransferase [Segetibacter sp. 3557_3]|nr:glycosyltransferase [Segetibacter sp. 3557_3]